MSTGRYRAKNAPLKEKQSGEVSHAGRMKSKQKQNHLSPTVIQLESSH
jgi:hypothetical protein